MAPFCPTLALRLLGEPLKLPSALTLWLGQERAREIVAGNLGSWLIRSAHNGANAPLDAAGLSPAGNDKLAAEIAAHPWRFAATASVAPSVAPCMGETVIEPRRIVLRLFLVHDGVRWQAMRGGLARALTDEESLSGRLPRQALSKDVWVLVDDAAEIVGPAQVFIPPLAIRRTPADMPARIAADFFWLGRYLERLESAARLTRATIARLGRAAPMPRERAELQILLGCLVQAGFLHGESVLGASNAALG